VIGDKAEENMKKIFIASYVAVLAMTAASAATRPPTEYFIVLDTKTKTCTIVHKKPKSKALKIVGDPTYRTQAEAENGMKIVKVCVTHYSCAYSDRFAG
jgi:hypothetical protein